MKGIYGRRCCGVLHELLCGVEPSASVGGKVDKRLPSCALISEAWCLRDAAKPLRKMFASNLAPNGCKACFCDGLFLLVEMAELVFEAAVDICVIESGLQLLDVGGFNCL